MPTWPTAIETYRGRSGNLDGAGDREYVRYYDVITDDPEIEQNAVLQATGLPVWGESYITSLRSDITATVQNITCSQDADDNLTWRVEVRYSTRRDAADSAVTDSPDPGGGGGINEPGGSPGDTTLGGGADGLPAAGDMTGQGNPVEATPALVENPLLRPPKISYSVYKESQILEEDYNATPAPIVNSAGQPFDPPYERQRAFAKLTITRNQATFNYRSIMNYVEHVNSVAWLGLVARTAKLDDMTADRMEENGIWFWQVTYAFLLRKAANPFNPVKILDAGFEEFNDAATATQPIIRDGGVRPSRPFPLDGNGNAILTGQDPVFLEFMGYPERDFNDFGFF